MEQISADQPASCKTVRAEERSRQAAGAVYAAVLRVSLGLLVRAVKGEREPELTTSPLDGLNKPYGDASIQYVRQYFNSLASKQGGNTITWSRVCHSP